MKIIIFLLIFLSSVSFADTVLDVKNKDWTSSVVYDETQTRFRAGTTYIQDGDVIVFVMDRFSGSCDSQYLGMNMVLEETSTSTFTTENMFGQMRIDEHPTHDINYQITFIEGKSIAFLNIMNFNGENELIKEMSLGKLVRFKLKTENKEYYLRFSLNGYRDASSRTLSLCKKYNQNSDKRYFENTPPQKKNKIDDSQYF